MHVPFDFSNSSMNLEYRMTLSKLSDIIFKDMYGTLLTKAESWEHIHPTKREQLNKLGCFHMTAYPQPLKIMMQKNS